VRLLARGGAPLRTAGLFGYGALALLFLYSTLELNSLLYWKLPAFRRGGMSILWAVFAIAFITAGIRKSVAALRYLGLALMLVVVGKVFLSDLSRMSMAVRVVAFLAVGLILLGGAFAYLQAAGRFATAKPGDPAAPDRQESR